VVRAALPLPGQQAAEHREAREGSSAEAREEQGREAVEEAEPSSMIYVVASVQATTCLALGAMFAHGGNWRLGIAQACYGVATIALFARAG
jgi:hypothetical protein